MQSNPHRVRLDARTLARTADALESEAKRLRREAAAALTKAAFLEELNRWRHVARDAAASIKGGHAPALAFRMAAGAWAVRPETVAVWHKRWQKECAEGARWRRNRRIMILAREKTAAEIAPLVGLSKNTVREIIRREIRQRGLREGV